VGDGAEIGKATDSSASPVTEESRSCLAHVDRGLMRL